MRLPPARQNVRESSVRSGRIRVEWEREGLETPDGSVSGKVFICFNIVAGWSFIVAKFKRGAIDDRS